MANTQTAKTAPASKAPVTATKAPVTPIKAAKAAAPAKSTKAAKTDTQVSISAIRKLLSIADAIVKSNAKLSHAEVANLMRQEFDRLLNAATAKVNQLKAENKKLGLAAPTLARLEAYRPHVVEMAAMFERLGKLPEAEELQQAA